MGSVLCKAHLMRKLVIWATKVDQGTIIKDGDLTKTWAKLDLPIGPHINKLINIPLYLIEHLSLKT